MAGRGKVLVTGALGYIGSRLVPYLAEMGYDCIAYDTGFFRDCTLYAPRETKTIIKDARALRGDDLKGVDAVVHLAGMSNDPFGNLQPKKVYDPTRAYALDIARLCKGMGIKFLFPSSCSVYGIGKDGLVDEDGETNPQTPYSLNKLQIEGDLKEISDNRWSPIILRLATVYGLSPRMRFDLVVNILTAMAAVNGRIVLNSNGRAWRPHVHIDDVARAFGMAIELEHRGAEPLLLNVGDTSQNFQVLQVAELVREQVPGCEIVFLKQVESRGETNDLDLVRDGKIQDGVDRRTYRVSFGRIEEVMPGFRCQWTVQNGIRSMLDCFRELPLTEEHIKNISFYRLQRLEHLFNQGCLTEDLHWKG